MGAGVSKLKEESPYVARETRQYIEQSAFVDDCVDYLIHLGVYEPKQFHDVCKIVKRWMKASNLDEGNELLETNAEVFVKQLVRDSLEDWG